MAQLKGIAQRGCQLRLVLGQCTAKGVQWKPNSIGFLGISSHVLNDTLIRNDPKESRSSSLQNWCSLLQNHQGLKLSPKCRVIINNHSHILAFRNYGHNVNTGNINILKLGFHTSVPFNEIIDERKLILDDKSKVEEFVEHQRKKREHDEAKMQIVEEKLQDAFIYMPDKPASMTKKEEKLPLTERIKNEIMHYYHGFRLLYLDSKVAAKLLWQVLNGKTLTRRQRRQVFCHP